MEVSDNQISGICELTELEILQVSGGDVDKPPQAHAVPMDGGQSPPQH